MHHDLKYYAIGIAATSGLLTAIGVFMPKYAHGTSFTAFAIDVVAGCVATYLYLERSK